MGIKRVCLLIAGFLFSGCSSTVATESTGVGQPNGRIYDAGAMDTASPAPSERFDDQNPDAALTPIDGSTSVDSAILNQVLDAIVVDMLIDASVVQTQDAVVLDAAQQPEPRPDFDGQSGALVTRDCLYRTYPYAVDILLSCGDERFGEVLRLHTFKRHAHEHRRVYNDQLITYRDQKLWFDAYDVPRCVIVDNRGRLGLSSTPDRCSVIDLVPNLNGFLIRQSSTGRCAGLGGAHCGDHQFTGGRECGGIQHRYLPMVMDSCDSAMLFTFEESADACDGFFPQAACF